MPTKRYYFKVGGQSYSSTTFVPKALRAEFIGTGNARLSRPKASKGKGKSKPAKRHCAAWVKV